MSQDLAKANQEKKILSTSKLLIKGLNNSQNMPQNCHLIMKPAVFSEPKNITQIILFRTEVTKVIECRTKPRNSKNLWLSPKSNSSSTPLTACPLPTTSRCNLCFIFRDHLIRQLNKNYHSYCIVQRFKNKYTTYKYFMTESQQSWICLFLNFSLCMINHLL